MDPSLSDSPAPTLTLEQRRAWEVYLNNEHNLGHTRRDVAAGSLDQHALACLASGRMLVRQLRAGLSVHEPRSILEIGSGPGTNCLALKEEFPSSDVIGIEPEWEALAVAAAMAQWAGMTDIAFVQGVGESICLPSGSVDLIVSNTVLEHVRDVDLVVSEIARVLSPEGAAYLVAPNYIWPYEPHLGIWCLPVLGKASMRMAARLQGKGNLVEFLGHLQLVTPGKLERAFKEKGLCWTNLMAVKLKAVAGGANQEVRAYRKLGLLLKALSQVGLAKVLVALSIAMRSYPSMIYGVKRHLGPCTHHFPCSK